MRDCRNSIAQGRRGHSDCNISQCRSLGHGSLRNWYETEEVGCVGPSRNRTILRANSEWDYKLPREEVDDTTMRVELPESRSES